MAEAGPALLSRLRRGADAFGFLHGVHPPESKELTAHLPIRRMPFPDEVVLPLRQHAGKPAIPVVKKRMKTTMRRVMGVVPVIGLRSCGAVPGALWAG